MQSKTCRRRTDRIDVLLSFNLQAVATMMVCRSPPVSINAAPCAQEHAQVEAEGRGGSVKDDVPRSDCHLDIQLKAIHVLTQLYPRYKANLATLLSLFSRMPYRRRRLCSWLLSLTFIAGYERLESMQGPCNTSACGKVTSSVAL